MDCYNSKYKFKFINSLKKIKLSFNIHNILIRFILLMVIKYVLIFLYHLILLNLLIQITKLF